MNRPRRHRGPRRLGAALLLAVASFATAAAAETLYVRSGSTELRATPSASGADLVALERGDAIEVLNREGSWVQGTARGQTGWVHKLKLSTTEPESSGSVLAGLGGGRGDYVKEAESGRGARGLDESAEAYARNEDLSESAIAAVKRMEKVEVTESEIEAFLRDGRLGEWSP